MILTVFAICISLYILGFFIHYLAIDFLSKFLQKYFQIIEIFPGDYLFSIKKLHLQNENYQFICQNAFFTINPFFKPFISLTVEQFSFEFNKPIAIPKNNTPKAFTSWLASRILQSILAFIIKTFQIKILDLHIKGFGVEFNFSKFLLVFQRTAQDFSVEVELSELNLIKQVPFMRIPSIKLRFFSQNEIIKYILTNRIDKLTLYNQLLSLKITQGKILLDGFNSTITVMDNSSSSQKIILNSDVNDIYKSYLVVNPIELFVVEINTYTKAVAITINDLSFSKKRSECGMFSITYNGNIMLSIPSLLFEDKRIYLSAFQACISLPLILDIGLFIQSLHDDPSVNGLFPNFAKTFNTQFQKNNEQDKKIEKKLSMFFSKIKVKSPSAILNILLSDKHNILFDLQKVSFCNMLLNAKEVKSNVEFKSKHYEWLKGTLGKLNIKKPFFSIEMNTATIKMTTEFPEISYLEEIFGILNFTAKMFRGPIQHQELEPPFRRKFSVKSNYVEFYINNTPFSSHIETHCEAKRHAIQELLLRQSKAIDRYKALTEKQKDKGDPKISSFNIEEFQKESQIILFKLYRSILNMIPEADSWLFKMTGSGIYIELDGPSCPNRETAMNYLKEIARDLNPSEVGKISGGIGKLLAKEIHSFLPKEGEICSFKDVDLYGPLFVVKPQCNNVCDYYHMNITCNSSLQNQIKNEYVTSLSIPMIASKSVTFCNIKGRCGYGKTFLTPIQLEFMQDFKLASRTFRRTKHRYIKIGFVDFCRIRCRALWNIECDLFSLSASGNRDPYSSTPLIEFKMFNAKSTFDSHNFVTEAKQTQLFLNSVRIGTLPRLTFWVQIVAFNKPPQTKDLRNSLSELRQKPLEKRPIFIKVDTRRLADMNYDPYEGYRTLKYWTEFEFTFDQNSANIDLDSLIPQIDTLFSKQPKRNLFIIPPKFASKLNPLRCRPIYIKTVGRTNLPSLRLSIGRGKSTFIITHQNLLIEFDSFLKYYHVTFDQLNFDISYNENNIFNLIVAQSKFFRSNGVGGTMINGLTINFPFSGIFSVEKLLLLLIRLWHSSNDLSILSNKKEKDINSNTSKSTKILPDILLSSDLLKNFTNMKESISITNSLTLRVQFEENQNLNIILENPTIEIRLDENGIKLSHLKANNSLFEITSNTSQNGNLSFMDLEILFSSASNRTITIFKFSSLAVVSRSHDIDLFFMYKPKIKQIIESFTDISLSFILKKPVTYQQLIGKTDEKTTRKFNRFTLDGTKISLSLLDDEPNLPPILEMVFDGLLLKYLMDNNGNENIAFDLTALNIKNLRTEDAFRQVFEMPKANIGGQNSKLLIIGAQISRKMLKIPVIQSLEIRVSPFILKLDFQAIQDIVLMFSTSKSFEIMDLDEDNQFEIELEKVALEEQNHSNVNYFENPESQKVEENIESVSTVDTEKHIFIGRFVFTPFQSVIWARINRKGNAHEFKNKALKFQGIQMVDIFGTKNELIMFVKKNLIWTAIRSFTSLKRTKGHQEDTEN